MARGREIPIQSGASATRMAEEIFGDGVTIVDASYTGDNRASGIYHWGDTISPGVMPSDSGVILSTGNVHGFTNDRGNANQEQSSTTSSFGPNNDPDFNAAAGTNTYDAAYLDVDFIPTGELMTMSFVFSSEEYPEFSESIFQDFVGVWVNGVQVELSVGDGDTDPNNINQTSNQNLFVSNADGQYNTEMDGFTVTLSLTFAVNPDQVNSIRIGIADVSDNQYDSNLLIVSDSLQSALIAVDDMVDVAPESSRTLDVLGNDINATGGVLTITHINGQAVTAGDSVTLSTGQVITLNADATFTVETDADVESVNFTYGIESSTGQSDTGFVTVNSVPCFVAGTMIRTATGEVAVEDLQPGDLVMTQDDGVQPVRWIGQRTVPAQGDFAPIRIAAGHYGAERDVMLSPQHRVLVRDSIADLLFGSSEVLVAAKNLVNGDSVQVIEGDTVTYVHLLFDRHQVVFSHGVASESFLPGPQTTNVLEQDLQAEICALFPELDPETGGGYSPAARRTLRSYEARLLMAARTAA